MSETLDYRASAVQRQTSAELQQLVRQNSQLTAAIASTTTGVVISDPQQQHNPIIFCNPAFTRITGYSAGEAYGRNCRFLQGPGTDPAAIAHLRQAIATRQTFRGMLRNYRKDGTPFWNNLTVNPVYDAAGDLIAFVGLQTDETARVEAEQALRESQQRLFAQNQELEQRVRERTQELEAANAKLEQAYNATLEAWSRLLDLRDNDTEGHSQRVTTMTLRLARALGLGDDELVHIRRGALLHDIGKLGVPDAILHKAGPLDEQEWHQMRQHPVYAHQALSDISFLEQALDIPRYHHEKWDGTGYPAGLSGEQIPLAARIFAVVDIWDALRSDRPYRKGWPEQRVREHIASLSGNHLDPAIVDLFLALPDYEASS
jgi:PAS domain S-box-containing protein